MESLDKNRCQKESGAGGQISEQCRSFKIWPACLVQWGASVTTRCSALEELFLVGEIKRTFRKQLNRTMRPRMIQVDERQASSWEEGGLSVGWEWGSG